MVSLAQHVALFVLLSCCVARAAPVDVLVTGPDGRPAADVAVMVAPSSTMAPPVSAQPVVIDQRDIRFVPYVTVVPVGSTVRFVNRDRFDHHVRSLPGGPLGNSAPARSFEFRLAGHRGGPEPFAEMKFDQPGLVALGCYLHGSMRGHLYVSVTPWVAVTDASGRATLPQVPDGAAELRLWHPDQLSEQAPLRIQVAPGAPRAEARLNFSPRARPAPRSNEPAYGPPGSN